MDIMTLIAIAAILLAAIADILTTERFLHHGYREAWPVMKWALDRFDHRAVAIGKMVFVAAWSAAMTWLSGFWIAGFWIETVWIIWAGAAFFTSLAIHNWRLVK